MDLTFSNNASMTTQCVSVSTIVNADMTAMSFNVNLSTTEAPSAVSLSPEFTTITVQNGMYTYCTTCILSPCLSVIKIISVSIYMHKHIQIH